MNNRLTSDSGKSVSLFPFLAVLLCTMGALLVLLVVLADRAGKRAVAEALQSSESLQPSVAPADYQQKLSDDSRAAAELERQLEEVHAYQQQLAELRQQADQRLEKEKQRLAHLEDHARRLEHELARLTLAAEQLKATEQNQSVDQQQAERELKRLQQLIADTEAQLEELREENSQGQRSYAIVPYRGPNGTYRKPIYIECRKDVVILHPEGVRLQPSDFAATSWPGNPLAAALRATRTHVNAQAAQAGAAEPPDPYPMILVRPDAIAHYLRVRAAITSWDTSYGYEFIDSDWKLSFPEAADPLLARKQQHAIMLAREQLARRIRSAPRKYVGVGLAGTASGARGGRSGTDGYGKGHSAGETGEGDFATREPLGQSQSGGTGQGNGYAAGQSSTDSAAGYQQAAEGNELQFGAMGGSGGEAGAAHGTSDLAEGTQEASEGSNGSEGNGGLGDRYSQTTTSGGSGEASTDSSGGADSGQAASTGGSAASGSATGGSSISASGQPSSIADSQGRNWAVQRGGRGAVPIRRTIQVVVRENQIALLQSRHTLGSETSTGQVISLDQPTNQISREFVAALRTRIAEWGLAGNGLYWRPMLKLNVGSGGEQTAEQVLRLLKNSGVEVSPPETARATNGRSTNVPR